MPIISLTTRIKAPIERVFDLSRSVELHIESSPESQETIVEGKTSGLLEKGDEITWNSHLKFRQKLHVKLTAMERYQSFVDEMVSGAFAHMKHTHLFKEEKGATLMTDEFDYKSPGGPFAWFVENSFLTAYLRRFLAERNKIIKRVAESEEWKSYLSDASPQD